MIFEVLSLSGKSACPWIGETRQPRDASCVPQTAITKKLQSFFRFGDYKHQLHLPFAPNTTGFLGLQGPKWSGVNREKATFQVAFSLLVLRNRFQTGDYLVTLNR
jgi:hypothetical protein